MKLDSIVDYFLCDGQGLFYFRPQAITISCCTSLKTATVLIETRTGELESVVLVYQLQCKSVLMHWTLSYCLMDVVVKRNGFNSRSTKTVLSKPFLTKRLSLRMRWALNMPRCQVKLKHSSQQLGFIPAVEVFNHMDCTGEATGNGEFDWLAHQILYHDELVRNIRKNMKFFGNPTLVSSRPKHDILTVVMRILPTNHQQSSRLCTDDGLGVSTRVSQPFGTLALMDRLRCPVSLQT